MHHPSLKKIISTFPIETLFNHINGYRILYFLKGRKLKEKETNLSL